MRDVLECLKERSGIAGVLDIQSRSVDNVVEKRLQLSVAKMASGLA
jgi:hypothetical protein